MSDENKIKEKITKEMQNSREWLSEFETPLFILLFRGFDFLALDVLS